MDGGLGREEGKNRRRGGSGNGDMLYKMRKDCIKRVLNFKKKRGGEAFPRNFWVFSYICDNKILNISRSFMFVLFFFLHFSACLFRDSIVLIGKKDYCNLSLFGIRFSEWMIIKVSK